MRPVNRTTLPDISTELARPVGVVEPEFPQAAAAAVLALSPGAAHHAPAGGVHTVDMYSLNDRMIVTTRHTDGRLQAFEDRDAQRNLRRYRALSAGFGVLLTGGACVIASNAIGTWADVQHRGPTKGESIAKFSLTVLGGVLAGSGALFSFIKAFGENDSDESWLRTWVPTRGCAAAAVRLASRLGVALSTKEKTRRKAELAALMHVWAELVSRKGTLEEYQLTQTAGAIVNGDLNAQTSYGKRALERALHEYIGGGVPPPWVIHPKELIPYHAVRWMWRYYYPDDLRVPSLEDSELRLRHLGFTTQAAVQALVLERFKVAAVGVEVPDEERRKQDEKNYLPGGGTLRSLRGGGDEEEGEE